MARNSRNPSPSRDGPKIWPRVAARFRGYRWMLYGTAGLVIVSVGLNMASPLLLREVIDNALPRHNTRMLIAFCGAMIVSGALASGVAVTLNAMSNWVGQQVIHGLRQDLYNRIQCMPLDFFATESPAEIQARMASDIGGISDIITFTGTSTLTAVVSLLAATLVMLVLSWPLALFCLVLAVGLSMFNRRFTLRRRDLAERRQEQMGVLLKLVDDHLTLSGIILGRTFLRYSMQRSRFRATSRQIADLTYRQRVAGSTARGVIVLTMSSLPPLIYLLAGTAVRGLSLGTAVVMVTLQLRLTGPIQQLLALNGRLQSSQAMFRRIFDYLDLAPAVTLEDGVPGQSASPAVLRACGIGHRYPHSQRAALTAMDIELRPGSTTLITGHTGSGKSTLALILAGLVEPTSGTVQTAGDTDRWHAVSCHELWQQVTLVPQETAMFNASIRENLLFARPDATDAQLMQAANAMQIGGFIASLPDRLNTMVGEHGYQLSGGERQRLALTRATLAHSRFLITDEATSALDGPTANAVHEELRDLCQDRALVIIAHRIPPMAWDDQVIVIHQGRIAYRGKHGELISCRGEYRQLLDGQAARTPDGHVDVKIGSREL
jgi:ATP-binding cassette subfamily B protein